MSINTLAPEQRKPFKTDEIAAYDNIMASNDEAAKLGIYQQIAKWPEAMKQDAYKQLGEKNPIAGVIGGTNADDALMGLRGDSILKGLEAGQGKGATWQTNANKEFQDAMGSTLRAMDPNMIQGKKRLYDSIYAAKFGPGGEFSPEQYDKIIEHVEDATFGTTNGVRVLAPKGVTGRIFEASLTHLPYGEVSIYGTPPAVWNDQHTDLVPPNDVDMSLWKPMRVEPGLYMFMNDRGETVATKTNEGVKTYFAKLDAATIGIAAAKANIPMIERGAGVTRMGAGATFPTAEDFGRLAIDPALVPALPASPPAPTDVPSLTTGVPGEGLEQSRANAAGGTRSLTDVKATEAPVTKTTEAPVTKATEVPATRAIQSTVDVPTELTKEEKQVLQDSLDMYKQSLKQAGRSKEYIDKAAKDYMDYFLNRADFIRRATILKRMQQSTP